MKFRQNMDENGPKVDLEGQGHRSKAKVTRLKERYFRSHLTFFEVKGHMGQGQKSHGSKGKVDLDRSRSKVKVTKSKM